MGGTDDVLSIARSYSEVFNARDWNKLDDILDPDIVDESIKARVVCRGSRDVAASLRAAADARPDAVIEVANAVSGGDQAVLELRMRATDPDTGKKAVLPTCRIYRVRGGKIDRLTTYSDGTWRDESS